MNKRAKLVLAGALLLLAAISSYGQKTPDKKKEAQLRTVHGTVFDKSDAAISSAVVFLKNLRTNQVRSYISESDGKYRFSGLDPNVDYEIHAEKDGAKSAVRTVSSFESRREISLDLKLDKRKE